MLFCLFLLALTMSRPVPRVPLLLDTFPNVVDEFHQPGRPMGSVVDYSTCGHEMIVLDKIPVFRKPTVQQLTPSNCFLACDQLLKMMVWESMSRKRLTLQPMIKTLFQDI
jgi:hypothetical protein